MYKKLAYASILWVMSIGLAQAQYSFAHYLGTTDDDRPYNMLQSSDGSFYVIGINSGGDYVYRLKPNGETIWTKNITHTPNQFSDIFEVNPDSIYLGGSGVFLIQEGNPTLTIINAQGEVKLNKVYPLQATTAGGISRMITNDKKREIISIGGGIYARPSGLAYFFQKTKYDGTLISYKYIIGNYSYEGFGGFLKDLAKEEYSIWTGKEMIKLDSNGNTLFIQNVTDSMRIDTNSITGEVNVESGDIVGVVQNANGTYTSLASITPRVFMQLHDATGKIIKRTEIPFTNHHESNVSAINKTATGGYILAGDVLRLLDSNWNEVWKTKLISYDEEGNSDVYLIRMVAQAADGGFYGCALSTKDFDNRNYDFFVFKTTPSGFMSSVKKTTNVKKSNISVYPNPSSTGIFTLSGTHTQPYTLKVMDATGKQIQHTTTYNGIIDVSGNPNGMYYIMVEDKEGNVLLKQSVVIAR